MLLVSIKMYFCSSQFYFLGKTMSTVRCLKQYKASLYWLSLKKKSVAEFDKKFGFKALNKIFYWFESCPVRSLQAHLAYSSSNYNKKLLNYLYEKISSIYRAFWRDVTTAILMSQNNETAALLRDLTSFLMWTLSFVPINLHCCWSHINLVKTLYK